jgi:hypothetical protein
VNPMPRCPNCGEPHVQRSHRRGSFERLLSLIYLYPFRCQLCRHRFRAVQWGRVYARREVDRREYDRHAARFPATFGVAGAEYEGTVVELSIDGCTAELSAPVVRGTPVTVSLRPGPEETLSIGHAVIRTVRAQRVGVQFVQLSAEEHDALHATVRRLLAAAPRSLVPPPTNPR